jgi:hypothetical protein
MSREGKPKIFQVSFLKMRFTVSYHTFEKHLYYSNYFKNASVFLSENVMLSCIKACLEKPDKMYDSDQRVYFEKYFARHVGYTWNCEYSFKVKLVCKKMKRKWLVVTAYPV